MWLRADAGQGACFAFTLPWPAAGSRDDDSRRRQAMTHKILIADDEPNILISLEFLMKREGYEVQRGARRPGGAGRHPRASARAWCCWT